MDGLRPWPPELLARVIKAMCPEQVCRVCGEPRRRIVGEVGYIGETDRPPALKFRQGQRIAEKVNQWTNVGQKTAAFRVAETVGFTDCGHNDYRPGLVLDPFGEATAEVATALSRDAIGIRNA